MYQRADKYLYKTAIFGREDNMGGRCAVQPGEKNTIELGG